ncbi:MAG: glycosyltransferase family 9 protein [Rhodocyclaceae bacterium]|nr:glycosyltransferase family 9 protein [Rhodocyclaceae bacterium]
MYLLLAWLLAPLAWLRLILGRRPGKLERILLIQTAKIGDYICTTPLIRTLKNCYPDASLTLLVHPVVEPLARHQPGVDRVLTLPDGTVKGLLGRLAFYRLLRQGRFDTTICISPNQAFLLMPFLAGIPRRAAIFPNFGGRSYRLARPFLSHAESHRQGRMTVETGMALLNQLGCNGPIPAKEIAAAPGAEERVAPLLAGLENRYLVGVGVSSGNKLKELGEKQLVALITGLLNLADDLTVVLVGSVADQRKAAALAETLNQSRVLDVTGRISLADLSVLVGRLEAYVGVDSGITYLADACGVPVVDIMGPADAEDQRPVGPKAIVLKPDLPCSPCSHAFLAPYDCMFGTRACVVEADMQPAVAAAASILRRRSANGAGYI